MAHKSNFKGQLLRGFGVLLILVAVHQAGYAQNTLTAEQYCRLTIDLDSLSVTMWQNKINLIEQFSTDKTSFLLKEKDLCDQEIVQRESVLSKYSITETDYVELMITGSMSELTASYLEENPDIKSHMDGLKAQIEDLINQYETSLKNKGIRG
jgi:hypothetical protein